MGRYAYPFNQRHKWGQCGRYGKVIISKFANRPCFGKKKSLCLCYFFGLLNFVCYLPFGLVMKKSSCKDCLCDSGCWTKDSMIKFWLNQVWHIYILQEIWNGIIQRRETTHGFIFGVTILYFYNTGIDLDYDTSKLGLITLLVHVHVYWNRLINTD